MAPYIEAIGSQKSSYFIVSRFNFKHGTVCI